VIFWNEDAVLDAIRAWHARHGRTPGVADWRNAGYGHPAFTTVIDRFGSWNKAIERAGFQTRSVGRRGEGPVQLAILASLSEPKSPAAVRDECGISDNHVRWTIGRLMRLGLVERVSRGVYVKAAA
jgi:Homing endonuclease associated repeat